MRVHCVIGLCRGVCGAGTACFDIGKTRARENIGIRLAARSVVTAVQAAVAGNDAGVACAEQGRAVVACREIGELRDCRRSGIVDGKTCCCGMGGAPGDTGIGQVRCAGPELKPVEIKPESGGSMPQAKDISSIALSSAIDPVASPGARINSGVPVSMRTTSCEVLIAGLA
jgi:hypothetical protein